MVTGSSQKHTGTSKKDAAECTIEKKKQCIKFSWEKVEKQWYSPPLFQKSQREGIKQLKHCFFLKVAVHKTLYRVAGLWKGKARSSKQGIHGLGQQLTVSQGRKTKSSFNKTLLLRDEKTVEIPEAQTTSFFCLLEELHWKQDPESTREVTRDGNKGWLENLSTFIFLHVVQPN